MIFRDESSQFFYQSGTEKSVIDFYNNDRFVLNYTFSSPLLKNVLVRRYLNVPVLITNKGDFSKAINLLAQFLVSYYSTFTCYNKLHDEAGLERQEEAKTQTAELFSEPIKI